MESDDAVVGNPYRARAHRPGTYRANQFVRRSNPPPPSREISDMNARTTGLLSVLFIGFAIGCGGTPGARPHDMSATHHEAAAAGHEAEASQHQAMYDPSARATQLQCRNGVKVPAESVCWEATVNPIQEHLSETVRHHRMAADHRAASQAL